MRELDSGVYSICVTFFVVGRSSEGEMPDAAACRATGQFFVTSRRATAEKPYEAKEKETRRRVSTLPWVQGAVYTSPPPGVFRCSGFHRAVTESSERRCTMTIPQKYRKLFQDAIVVNIPLDVTADLGVAIKRTRAKRIQALYSHFPSLKKKETVKPSSTDDVQHDDQDEEEEEPRSSKNKQKPNLHQPLREQYASVLDYLEAKYVMGVTVPSSEGEDEDEDRGSVYSETSFLDDTQLKSELAEQVLSQKTQAKVAVGNDTDDDEFFVNVGNLEVEEHDLMDYDPLEEDRAEKKEAKKRKRSDATKTSVKSSKSITKKPKTDSPNRSVASKTKSTPKSAGNAKEGDDEERPEDPQEHLAFLKQEALDKKDAANDLYDTIVKNIKAMTDEELPRRKKTSKVSLIVSEGKGPGDTIMFSNPHIPGQRLQVKVPKGLSAGGKFIVSVPAPAASDDTDANINWTREFQELVADFSSTYDEWCHAEGKNRSGQ